VRLFRRRETEQSAMLSLAMGAVIGTSLALVTQQPSPVPAAMKEKHLEPYRVLSEFYGRDPAGSSKQ
jgi:hypothetical protein